jgi:hypothetical protein
LNFDRMITEIEREIAKLNLAKAALITASTGASAKSTPGRPAKVASVGSGMTKASKTKKRTMSAAARKKIAAAQKARWAKLRAEKMTNK